MVGKSYIQWVRNRHARIDTAIPQFLHEFTHRWCFDSAVGRALAFVRLRTRYALLFGGDEDVEIDLATYETAKRLLQPFSEGLALFAEFQSARGWHQQRWSSSPQPDLRF